MAIKYWEISEENKNNTKEIIDQCGFSALVARVASARGLNAISANGLNKKSLLQDYPPMADIDKAVMRIRQAIEEGEPIAVYGDYDCDGITSTALLYSYLESEGADISYYIPDRDTEGYGLNKKAINALHKTNIKLIITVDNGISAIEEVDYAATLGIDVVITDHHKPREILPAAVAVVNPHRVDCPSGLTCMCGVGVVFALLTALEDGDDSLILDQYADIIAIGTVADVVNLIGINRTIVEHGIELIRSEHRTGIRKLLEICSISAETVTSENISYSIVPRINAAGRIGDVEASLCLLLTEDEEQAEHLARELESYNRERKELENKIITDISCIIKNNPSLVEDRVIVIDGTGWHHGVIGIVSAKISERYGKPTILICCDSVEARGSARSIEGFSIINAIASTKEILTRYGGHDQAAGLSLTANYVSKFRKLINEYAKQNYRLMPYGKVNVDCIVKPQELTINNIKGLAALAPFGAGNPYPVFVMEDMTLSAIQSLAAGKHLKLKLVSDNKEIFALYFNMSPDRFMYKTGDKIDIAFTVDINVFNNTESVSVKICSMRPHGIDQNKFCKDRAVYQLYLNKEPLEEFSAEIIPTREDSGMVYRKIKEIGTYPFDKETMYMTFKLDMNYCKFLIILEILEELLLISTQENIKFLPVTEKKDFNSSLILKNLTV